MKKFLVGFCLTSFCLMGCNDEKQDNAGQNSVVAAKKDPTQLVDSRDGKTYRIVKIGNQTWMAENLNFATPKSWCYGDNSENCDQYGRLYTWDEAMSACPAGWSVPSNADFETLKDFVKGKIGSDNVATALKGKDFGAGKDGVISGTDMFGFNAVASGDRVGKKYQFAGEIAYLWSSTDEDDSRAYDWVISAKQENFDHGNVKYSLKKNGFSVRCIQGAATVQQNVGVEEGSMVDSRDGQSYKTVKIGNQVWMAENLNFKAKGSSCANGNCEKYGRLYEYNKSVCPEGWHMPNDTEWGFLINYAKKNSPKGKHDAALRSVTWMRETYTVWSPDGEETETIDAGTDKFGFNAIRLKYTFTCEGGECPRLLAAFWSSDKNSHKTPDEEKIFCQGWQGIGAMIMDACEDAACGNWWNYSCGEEPIKASVRCLKN